MNKDTKQTNIEKVDMELEALIDKRIAKLKKKLIAVGTGITSSHLGDERNIREFLVADALVKKLRSRNYNVIFYLFDDSFDPLNFRQLRVGVNKDEALIKKFEKYCGTPIALIPDPFECHANYSAHFQNEILKRFHSLDIYPNIIDINGSYQSGLYDYAKEIVFTKHKEIRAFLKENFPQYTMKKLFYALCPNCLKIDGTDIKRISNGRIRFECSYCNERTTQGWKEIQGKFSWKIDVAIKWNIFKVDFEPYSKAYLDPDVGSYFIAKKLSEKFFGGYYPENVNYGQIIMDKSLSYRILPSFPREIINAFFVQNRKKDMELSDEKLIQVAHTYKVDDHLSFYDYVLSKLPFEIFEVAQGKELSVEHEKIYMNGVAFAKNFLNQELFPQLPIHELFRDIDASSLSKIQRLFKWAIEYKYNNSQITPEIFLQEFTKYLKENKVSKSELFPSIRKLLSQEHSLPMYRIFYYSTFSYLGGCLEIINEEIVNLKKKKIISQKRKESSSSFLSK
jgi:tRNA synthetase class I (K)